MLALPGIPDRDAAGRVLARTGRARRSEKRMVVEAMVIAVLDDGRLTVPEAELLRAVRADPRTAARLVA